jgi:hypothetical protein
MSKVLQSGLSRHLQKIGEVRETKLNVKSPQLLAMPFYNLLPEDHVDLIRFRIYVRQRCLEDLAFREQILDMCSQDVCFYANVFCYVFEPRPPRNIPLKIWNDQANILAWMQEVYGERDMGIEKTRGIGLSWDVAIFYSWVSRFKKDAKLAVTTKDEDSLDGPDSNTIMGKIAYVHEHLPEWFKVNAVGKDILKRVTTQHIMSFLDTGVTIQGFPPMDEKLRSMRFTSVFYDEFGFFPRDAQKSLNAAVHTSPNRFFVSTWNGPDNVFHYIMRKEQSTMLRVLTYWWNNEERYKGAYKTENGVLKVLDKDYRFEPDYPFVLDGLLRSAWVDYELRRAGSNKQSALEELYGLQAEGGRKFFRLDTVEFANTTVKAPMASGVITKQGNNIVLAKSLDANIDIWDQIGDGRSGPFAAACDLSFGSGASFSTLEIIDLSNGSQVLDCADNGIEPVPFAQYVYEILKWLNGHKGDEHTFFTFESNGDQGKKFGQEMIRLGYGNIARKRYSGVAERHNLEYYGYRNRDKGNRIFGELERAVRDGELTIRSNAILEEMKAFDRDPDKGLPEYPKSEIGHGDRLMALAMAWQLGRDRLEAPLSSQSEHNVYSDIEGIQTKRTYWSTEISSISRRFRI